MIKYFVSFVMHTENENVFGNVVIDSNGKINNAEGLETLAEAISDKIFHDSGVRPGEDIGPVIVLNFQEL